MTVWQIVGAGTLALFLLSTIVYVVRNYGLKDGKVYLKEPPGKDTSYIDPLTGLRAWPWPDPPPVSNAVRYPRLLRLLLVLTLVAGLNYVQWRWRSVVWDYWWISVPLVLADTLTYLELMLVSLMLWRIRARPSPPAPPPGLAVDVFITCYNEPVEIVRATVKAAKEVRYPHKTYVLDDGNNPEMRAMAEEEGVGYIIRSQAWKGKNRHAKAGNISNALLQTDGEFILFQDADQIPFPHMLDRLLGYFNDPMIAFIQSPHWFYNVPPHDPMGAQQPIFYGPVLQGRDGFNAAFFCGSNGMMRREALMQVGLMNYAREMEARVPQALKEADQILIEAQKGLDADAAKRLGPALQELRRAVKEARRQLAGEKPLQDVTWDFQRRVNAISATLIREDLEKVRADLEDMGDRSDDPLLYGHGATVIAGRELSPLYTIAKVQRLVEELDVHRSHEAQPVIPFSTVAVTEDLATSMRMHSLGWRSVYHHEILARGLAPEDLRSSLTQRLRWAQGAFQTVFKEFPFFVPGLSLAQKFLYLHTCTIYLFGFAAIVYMLAPAIWVLFGIGGFHSTGWSFAYHLIPYVTLSFGTFLFWIWGLPAWRSVQYNLAYFPVYIQSLWTAFSELAFGKRLAFIVTPKVRQSGVFWRLVFWQLFFMALMVVTVLVGLGRIALGWDSMPWSTYPNVMWAWLDLAFMLVIVEAALYKPSE